MISGHIVVSMKIYIYKASENMLNVYKSNIMVYLNYDCRAHLVFHSKWKNMTSGQIWKIKYNTPAIIFDCVL